MRLNRTCLLSVTAATAVTVSGLLAAGCGPHKSPREIELGSRAEDTPSPAASAATMGGDAANAFPSVALDYPPPTDAPGVDAAETAAITAPKSAPAALNLGYAYYRSAAYTQAVEAFDKAVALAPTQPEPLLYAAQSSMGVGVLPKALTDLTKASVLPKVSPEMRSQIFLQIGNINFQQRKDTAARTAFAKSLVLNPKQGGAKIALGTYAAMDKQPAKAKTFFAGAVGDLPSSRLRGKAYASLGLLAEQAHDKPGAVANYKKALSDDPNNSAAKAGVARAKPLPP